MPQEEGDELPLDLVEALPDVRAATSEVFTLELGQFEVQSSEVPGIFSTRSSVGASK